MDVSFAVESLIAGIARRSTDEEDVKDIGTGGEANGLVGAGVDEDFGGVVAVKGESEGKRRVAFFGLEF